VAARPVDFLPAPGPLLLTVPGQAVVISRAHEIDRPLMVTVPPRSHEAPRCLEVWVDCQSQDKEATAIAVLRTVEFHRPDI